MTDVINDLNYIQIVFFRCLYIAHTYLLTKRWKEATALYEKVVFYAEEAISQYEQLPNEPKHISKIQSLIIQAQGHMYTAHASYLLGRCNVAYILIQP